MKTPQILEYKKTCSLRAIWESHISLLNYLGGESECSVHIKRRYFVPSFVGTSCNHLHQTRFDGELMTSIG